MDRRAFLVLVPAALAACTFASGAPLPNQLALDAQGMLKIAQADLPLMVQADPALMSAQTESQVAADLAAAKTAADRLVAGMSAAAGATVLQQFEDGFNAFLDATSAIANAPTGSPLAKYAPEILAITVLAQGIESFVNLQTGTASKKAALRAKALAPAMTSSDARKRLGIPTP